MRCVAEQSQREIKDSFPSSSLTGQLQKKERAFGLLCMRVLISSALNKDSLNGRISNARRGPVPELYSIILFLLLPSSFHFFMMDR
jgi:hypothetical protein